MRELDHIGLRTSQPQEGERFVQKTRVWVTDPQLHPFRVEWLRYEPDSPVSDELKDNPHLAWHVDSIEEESRGLTELIAPFHSVANHRVGFYRTPDGAIVELMEY
jgi:catechol 2,3-dioxygenase-like lactoylglutathione lyase family enzyme